MTAPWLCPNLDCRHRVRTGAPAELPPDVAVCPHCGTDGAVFVPLVTVASFPDPYLGHLVRSRLEADGIVATISDEHLASMTHIAGDGGVKLRVRRDQVEAALAIVQGAATAAEHEAGSEPEPEWESESDASIVSGPACPRCGATVTAAPPPARFLARVFGVRRRCACCAHTWRG